VPGKQADRGCQLSDLLVLVMLHRVASTKLRKRPAADQPGRRKQAA